MKHSPQRAPGAADSALPSGRWGPTGIRLVGISLWMDDGLLEQVLKGALLLGSEAGQR